MRELKELKDLITGHRETLETRYRVKNIALFGSYVRGEQTEESDLDVLVEFKEPVGLLFVHLADYLEDILGVKVDLLTPDAIKPNRRPYIMEDLIHV